jgi:hypothetical protein
MLIENNRGNLTLVVVSEIKGVVEVSVCLRGFYLVLESHFYCIIRCVSNKEVLKDVNISQKTREKSVIFANLIYRKNNQGFVNVFIMKNGS